MWENFKESEFGKKIIKVFSNRGVVITTALVVLVLTIAITATVATNRANKQNAEQGGKLPTDTTQQTQKAPDTDALGKGEDTVPVYNEGNGTEQVIEKVEGFALPVVGTLGAKHDASVQVWSPTMEEYRIHLGIDITTEDAAPVYAAAAGTVAQIWDDPMMGTCVAISHEGDVVTIYKNLAANLADGIVAGKEVKGGQQIGTVGGTATLADVEETLGIEIGDEDSETFGGYVLGLYGSVPMDGSTFELSTDLLDISIETIKDHKIEKAIVTLKSPEEESEADNSADDEKNSDEDSDTKEATEEYTNGLFHF